MKLLYTTMLLLHVLGVVIWVGGMFMMHVAVRPAAVELLQPPQRLPLLARILGRFFDWVAIAVVAVLASGIAMILGGGGLRNAHLSVHVMLAIGVTMTAIFVHIRVAPYKRLQAAIVSSDWPQAAQRLDQIRVLEDECAIAGRAKVGRIQEGRMKPFVDAAVVSRGEQLHRYAESLFGPGLQAGVVTELESLELAAQDPDPEHRHLIPPVGAAAADPDH